MNKKIFSLALISCSISAFSQYNFTGTVVDSQGNPTQAVVSINKTEIKTNENGLFIYNFDKKGNYPVSIIDNWGNEQKFNLNIKSENQSFTFVLKNEEVLNEIVIQSTKNRQVDKGVIASESYSSDFFKKTTVANVLESMEMINGVQPKINCGVCNTGDIRINGLEGTNTLVLIDGLPMVSGLSTVYGLSGIPVSMIEKIEVIKGPAPSIYGTEAIGGMINIITKNPLFAPTFSFDTYTTSWGEVQSDLGFSTKIGKKINYLAGLHHFNYSGLHDKNKDNFTDLSNQHRISFFQKFQWDRKSKKDLSLITRYYYEDRWGGELQWNRKFRGSEEIYGESIYTNRWEILGNYQLPTKEDIRLQTSIIGHYQDAFYGNSYYKANQTVAHFQGLWNKTWHKNQSAFGIAFRNYLYDDNTPATEKIENSKLWSIFGQNSYDFAENWQFFAGFRAENHSIHGNLFTPRIALKKEFAKGDVLRLNAGTGHRVVSLFTEDHAALTGARQLVITENLKPERSWNANLSYVKNWVFKDQTYMQLDASAWFTHFSNKIAPDYDTDVQKIIYSNLDGYAQSKGISANVDITLPNGIKFLVGGTMQQVQITENQKTEYLKFAERFSGNWAVTVPIEKWNTTIDYTGTITGPMDLPTLGENDPRRSVSPTFALHNIQATYKGIKRFDIYAGIRNLTNWTVSKTVPFIISRSQDPFDKNVNFDTNGNPIKTADNPYGLTFDPSYIYGTNQGIRAIIGIRYQFL